MKKTLSLKGIGLGFLIVILVLLVVYQKNLTRLYTAVTLYDKDKIANNFLTMYESFNATVIPASSQPLPFPVDPQPLPELFDYEKQPMTLTTFLEDTQTTGLLVLKDGNIVYENYWFGHARDKQHISFSMAKSFVSALMGIAIEEGFVTSIEEAVTDYVPELVGSGYEGVRIKDVLQMSSGVGFNEDYGDFNSDINRFSRATAFGTSLDDFSASLVREREPGTYHHYVSIDTQVLGMVLTRATGQSLSHYLSEKIWQPLGMEYKAFWLADDDGMELALGGLNVSLRDYAKLGWLYLNQGTWTDNLNHTQQIVPKQWVIDSTRADAPHLVAGENNPASSSSFGYGYQWWLPLGAEDEFAAQGIYDQYIYIDPDQKLVIVKNSANYRYTDKSLNWKAKHYAMFRAISEHFSNKQ
ncbi:serine hydrolase domain-containing protein [Paraglaciecola arctica]|uniref:Predicted beta-lactamase class C n=1 Tax=Paraglaciecola arctica BSs20135 TaxID=493475 RepID=K6YC40_9ALTE|nr:serine hydrolase [Paraglaciecola arctica]GAC21521.1 predicted beta-lactamase class C [Paraglaciecola arctica BSs20135]